MVRQRNGSVNPKPIENSRCHEYLIPLEKAPVYMGSKKAPSEIDKQPHTERNPGKE
jgi:hypothetical protein